MAHRSEVVGRVSEMTARRALLNAGYEVAKPETDEPYDVVFRDPVNGAWATAQIKTVRVREDRGGALVIYAKKGNGQPYTKADADYIVGVLGNRVYITENTEQAEYWSSSETRAAERWIELPAELVDVAQ